MTNWFYQLEGKEAEGPVSTTQLKELAKNGTLKQTDLIWKEGYEKWVKAKRLHGLFPEASFSLPPIPENRKSTNKNKSAKNGAGSIKINIPPASHNSEIDSKEIYHDTITDSVSEKITIKDALLKNESPAIEMDFPPPLPKNSDDNPIWFFSKGKTQYGPISTIELLRLFKINQISEDDLTWRKDMNEWIPLKETELYKNRLRQKRTLRVNNKNEKTFEDNLKLTGIEKIFSMVVANTNIIRGAALFLLLFSLLGLFLPWFSNVDNGGIIGEKQRVFRNSIDQLRELAGQPYIEPNPKSKSILGISQACGLYSLFFLPILFIGLFIGNRDESPSSKTCLMLSILSLLSSAGPGYHFFIFKYYHILVNNPSSEWKPITENPFLYLHSDMGFGLILSFFSLIFITMIFISSYIFNRLS